MRTEQPRDRRRGVPRTDVVLADPRLVAATSTLSRATLKNLVAMVQERARRGEIPMDAVADVVAASLPARATTLRPVINATGVVLHTNLGRAPLSAAAIDALRAAAGSTDVEFDLATGDRARRGRDTLDALAAAVPAAESVHVVNNGAAALVLAATALAAGREVVVSRGELIEIGDGFRLSDLLQATGARLREVGTTNRTALADYEAAIGQDTAFVLKVHPSNFVVRGFTSAVPTRELAGLGLPVVVDIGSGLLTAEPLLPTSRTRRRRWKTVPRSSRPAGTSCSVARRPVCSSAVPTSSIGFAGIPLPARCGSTSSRSPRWRRRCGGRSHPPGRRCTATWGNCGHGLACWRSGSANKGPRPTPSRR